MTICGWKIENPELLETEIRKGAYNILLKEGKNRGKIFMNHCQGILHIVQKGDTLYLLSRRYHIPLWMVLNANPYVNIYNLQVGDEICIPCRIRPREDSCLSDGE